MQTVRQSIMYQYASVYPALLAIHFPVVTKVRINKSLQRPNVLNAYLYIIAVVIQEEPAHPCNPSPCGANAVCKELNGTGSCTCLPEYFGDPYLGCRPECIVNTDCPRNKACINNKCVNPCPGTCGLNAECLVNKHTPTCSCLPRFTGNPLQACHPIPESKILYCIFILTTNTLKTIFVLSTFCSTYTRTMQSITLWTVQHLQSSS